MRGISPCLIATALLGFAAAGCADEAPPSQPVASSAEPIVGGISDTWRSYVVGVGDSSGAFCSGTVISRHSVLTAGHCYPGITKIFVGDNINGNAATTVDVIEEVRDPQWNGQTLSHDLTMLKLGSIAPTQPGLLLYETMDNTASWIGPNFNFVGYGVTNGPSQTGFGIRRVVSFPIAIVGPGNTPTEGAIDDTQYYYDVPNKNTCNGDSGGPAFAVRGVVERVSGTTSYGDNPCKKDGVNARADQPTLDDWVQSQIDAFEGTLDPCRADGVCDDACNTGGQLVDPDCGEQHCGADGICVLSCVMPVDPDCVGIDHCGLDGACDPTCPTFDPDCLPLCGADGTCVPTCPTPDPDCATATASSSTGTGGAGGAGGATTTTASTSTASTSTASTTGAGGAGGAAATTTVSTSTASSTGVGGAMATSSSIGVGGAMAVSSSIGVGGTSTVVSSSSGFGGGMESSSSEASSSVGSIVVGAGTGDAGVGGAGGGGSGSGGSNKGSGCGCTVVGDNPNTELGWLGGAFAAALTLTRRRRFSRTFQGR